MDFQTIIMIVVAAVVVGAVALMPAALVWFASRSFFPPRVRMEPLDPDAGRAFLEASRPAGLWAERHGWLWVGAYVHPAGSFAETQLEVWRSPGLDRFLIAYRHKLKPAALFLEFMTLFDDANHLDTLTSRDDLNLPDVPGRFMQVFPGEGDLDRLWSVHEQGERWAAGEHALRPRPATEDFESLWIEGAARVIRGIMSRPLWFLRIWAWQTRALTLAGRPVSERRGLRPAGV